MGYKIFVAGSKDLDKERDACRSVCNMLQNQWGTITTKTFEDFDETVSDQGHQKEYNEFIENEADLVIFLFSSSVGSITRDEFEHAYRSFKEKKHPKIIVYFDKRNSDNKDVLKFKRELAADDQYYQEYESIDELKLKVEKHINKLLGAKQRNASWSGKFFGVPALFVGVWLLLGLIGGIVMYIVDCNMSDKTCKELAIRYVETLGNGVMYYNFPDETFVYDMNNKTLSIEPRNSELSSGNVNIGSIKDVTLASTTSLLLTRSFKFKPKGNAKMVATYVAGAACLIIGCGAGCIVEQMIFPPQYSDRVREYLMVEENWEYVIAAKAPTRIF